MLCHQVEISFSLLQLCPLLFLGCTKMFKMSADVCSGGKLKLTYCCTKEISLCLRLLDNISAANLEIRLLSELSGYFQMFLEFFFSPFLEFLRPAASLPQSRKLQ